MIFKAYQTFAEFNNTQGVGFLLYPAHIMPAFFIPMVLFAIFMIISLSTYFSQRRLTGKGDFLASFSVGSYVITVVAFLMTLVDNLINVFTISVCVVMSILSTTLLILSKNK